MATRDQWIESCDTFDIAQHTEDSILSCGREYLPACAIAVLDGADGTPEYWDFLIEQARKLDEQSTVGHRQQGW